MNSNYDLNFVGNQSLLNDNEIFNYFDVNYLPLANLPLTYYNLLSKSSYSNVVLPKIDLNRKQLEIIGDGNYEKGQVGDFYNYIIFNENNKLNVKKDITDYSILLVGGGGGGGNGSGSFGGGGGGGGQVYFHIGSSDTKLVKGEYTITIGNGGLPGNDGFNTSINMSGSEKYIALGGIKGQDGGNGKTGDGGNSYKLNDKTITITGGVHNSVNGGGGGSSGIKDNDFIPNTDSTANTLNYNDVLKKYFKNILSNEEKTTYNYIGAYGITNTTFINRKIVIGGGGNGYYGLGGRTYNEITPIGGGGKSLMNGIKNTGGGGGGGNGSNNNTILNSISTQPTINPVYIQNTNHYYFKFINGTTLITLQNDLNCDILIVGGGGGGGSGDYGGNEGGGGGAGGVVYITNTILRKGTYKIVVGNGGEINRNGGDSKITNYNDNIIIIEDKELIGKGGGYGAKGGISGGSGGSGGGGNSNTSSGSSNQGDTYWNGTSYIKGGSNGQNGRANIGGNGGGASSDGYNGISINITGANVYYAGGGAGVIPNKLNYVRSKGGGGTPNTIVNTNTGMINPDENTGSGGGGIWGYNYNLSNFIKAKGAKGVIIIKFNNLIDISNNNGAGSGGSGLVILKYSRLSNNNITAIKISDENNIKELGNELEINLKKINNKDKPYNKFNIGEMRILIIIIWILIFIFILKYLSYHFTEYYIYIIITIIISLLLLGSLWFLYVNNEMIL